MLLKENEKIRQDIINLNNHFLHTELYPLTQEQLLGFLHETNVFGFGLAYISDLNHYFKKMADKYTQFFEIKNDDIDETSKLHKIVNLLSDGKFRHSLGDSDGLMDEYCINGHLSTYKEWIDFAAKYDIHSKENFEVLKSDLFKSSEVFKKSADVLHDLFDILSQMEDNKRNLRYIKTLINEFMDVYENNIEDSVKFLDEIKSSGHRYENALNVIELDIINMKNRLEITAPEVVKTLAQKFYDAQKSSNDSISTFLKSKEFDDVISTRLQLKGQVRADNILFIDGSYAYLQNGEYHHTINCKAYNKSVKELGESAIGHILRKKPKVASFFKKFIGEESITDVIPVIDTYQQYSDVINNALKNITEVDSKSLEVLDDLFNATILKHKINQYINSIMSKKYEHLLTDDSKKILKNLYTNGISKQSLQEFIGKKMAAIKTPEDFVTYLKKVNDHFSGFTEDNLMEKLKGFNITETYRKDSVVIFRVQDFDQSNRLGSVSWCISRAENYFNTYTNQNCRQYFMYDFNKAEEDLTSMIGFTLYNDGRVRASHLKNDDDFSFSDEYHELHLETLKNDFKHFDLNEDYTKIMKEKYNLVKTDTIENKNKNKGPKL